MRSSQSEPMADLTSAEIRFVINGRPAAVRAHPMARLLDVLRHELHLTGTKEGCGEGECGACAVLVDGEIANSCLLPVLQAAGTSITTIEGVSSADGTLHRVQQAFVDHGGAQCGICTPGMLIAARVLLDFNPSPSRAEIKEAIAGNLCRCTGYVKIIDAIEAAALSENKL